MVLTPSTAIGLCAACTHARRVESARRSVFLRCAHHDVDEHYPKYPRLPVTACAAFEASVAFEERG